MYDEVVDKKVE